LLAKLKSTAQEFSPPDNPNRIINHQQFERLEALLDCGTIYSGGACNEEELTIEPTILVEADEDSAVMKEEIFGPILPVASFHNFNEALDRIGSRPSPLTAYLFSRDRTKKTSFRNRVRAGSICINDTITQLLPAELPFGGVGESGHGRYHGRAGFQTFSNLKSVFTKPLHPDPKLRYPPYKTSLATLKKAYRWIMR